ncbi:MAG: hypothetical protein NC937_00870 [Candidatus Omnitrophica bacterium]|nr:hypothetical protein [Candidatus Omnitrophota bacterium]MCM8824694.1 hypothetical protein [Candidatus Omnitrophota bacterium]
MRIRRKKPDWLLNIALATVFLFCYLIIYCKAVALGYKVSELEKNCQQLKNWNQYYRSLILRELSLERVKLRMEKNNLSLTIPETWRIISFDDPLGETESKDKNAHAAEK